MKITAHFNTDEFRCPHCRQLPWDEIRIAYLKALCNELELVRRVLNRPILINSGYRCPEHNKAVGGKPNSMHLKCLAADIAVRGLTGMEIFRAIHKSKANFSGIGIASSYVHVDIGGIRRFWTYPGVLKQDDTTIQR